MSVLNLTQAEGQCIHFGLSTDTKPTGEADGHTFIETDTGKVFQLESSVWTEKLNTSYGTQGNLDLKASIASPTFTGTVGGITKTMVGLGNVDNTSDANKPVSTSVQTALDLKATTSTLTGSYSTASTISGTFTTSSTLTASYSTTSTISGTYAPTSVLVATYAPTSVLLGQYQTPSTVSGTYAPLASPPFTGTVTIPTPFTLGAVSVTPTGTELNFVDGVTSAIQTQLDAKQASDTQLTSLAGLTYAGNSLKAIRLNVGETDFEFYTAAGGGDMVLADAQTVTGAKTFNNTKFLLRNVADTFNGSFVNTNTADRIYTLKDAAGTLAFTTDITGTNSNTNTGDQTSIVGISGTKAQFNTAVSDGDIVYLDSTDAITGVKTMSGLNVILVSSSGLTIRNPANSFKYTITAAALAADRILNLPLISGTDTLGALGLAQTWTAVQTFVAPVLGAATATSINAMTITSSTGTFTLTAAKTFAVTNTLTLSGTDSTVMTFPTTSATIARTDAANTFTGIQTFSTPIATAGVATMSATVGGGVPTPPNSATQFLNGTGVFSTPAGGSGISLGLGVAMVSGMNLN